MRLFRIIALLAILIPTYSYAYISPGSPTGYVNDFARVLTPQTVDTLNQELTLFSASTTNEISVVTVPTIGDDYIEHYALKLFEDWKIGTTKNDNGVLLVLATEDRKSRIEVGYGLEGALPDSVADSILRDMTDSLRAGDYDTAITGAVASIMSATRNEYVGTGTNSSNESGINFEFVFFAVIFGLQWLVAILGRTKSWWLGGVLGAGAGGSLSFLLPDPNLLVIGAAAAVLGGIGLLFDYIVSKGYHSYQDNGSNPPWYFGGPSHTGGFGGSGGFGGFGGGRSGGGGASGSW